MGFKSGRKVTFCAERLQQARECRGLSQRQLAAKVGVHVEFVKEWEKGGSLPKRGTFSVDQVASLALALGFPVSFFYQEPPPPLGPTSLDYHGTRLVCDACDEDVESWQVVEANGQDFHPECSPPRDRAGETKP